MKVVSAGMFLMYHKKKAKKLAAGLRHARNRAKKQLMIHY